MTFRTFDIDPPWNEKGGGKIKRGADKHYPLLKTPEEIINVIKDSGLFLPDKNCHMYLWVTNNFLIDGLQVMKGLDFTYKTNFVWAKKRMGIGQYFRGKHEICLFGIKGKGQHNSVYTEARDIPSMVEWDHEKDENGKIIHSAKPKAFYELVEKRSKGPYVEFFARSKRNGWESWGNEV